MKIFLDFEVRSVNYGLLLLMFFVDNVLMFFNYSVVLFLFSIFLNIFYNVF